MNVFLLALALETINARMKLDIITALAQKDLAVAFVEVEINFSSL